MLKSTHRAGPAQAPPPSLPSPWTEHKAPSGHTYYYNPDTKKSTYTRPTVDESHNEQHAVPQNPEPIHWNPSTFSSTFPSNAAPFSTPPPSWSGGGGDNLQRRGNYGQTRHFRHREDRPKSKHAIPGCDPWLLIKTRLGRRFVHNPSTRESFWKVPQDLIGGLVEFDIQERDGKEQPDKSQNTQQTDSASLDQVDEHISPQRDPNHNGGESPGQQREIVPAEDQADSGSDEYEEVEVTDDEGEEDGEQTPKRQKLDAEDQPGQSVEMGEDDMAYQLAQMGASYDLDPGEYGEEDYEGDWEEGAEGIPLTAEEAAASFKDILDDYHVNPYTMWDSLLTDNRIVEDDRYTLLPNMKTRKDVFDEWSAAKIETLKQQREQQIKQNPRIPYLAFLHNHATPKLYWPEFKRKFKREPELRDAGLSDKDREKLYREHITRVTKSSDATLRNDLEILLESIPPSQLWNRSTSLDGALPSALLTDIRYISLQTNSRDRLVKDFINTLPVQGDVAAEERSLGDLQQAKAREKRELALKQRSRQVQDSRRQQEKQLLRGQQLLEQEEAELGKALRIGKGALLENLQDADNSKAEES